MDTLIITTNLGHFKAFRVMETPTRGPKLELVEEMEFPEAHFRLSEQYTDAMGRYFAGGPAGSPRTAPTEALTLGLETERRLIALAARKIEELVEKERCEGWYFAARDEIREAILAELKPDLRKRITKSAPVDLTKTPAPKVLSHFPVFPA